MVLSYLFVFSWVRLLNKLILALALYVYIFDYNDVIRKTIVLVHLNLTLNIIYKAAIHLKQHGNWMPLVRLRPLHILEHQLRLLLLGSVMADISTHFVE